MTDRSIERRKLDPAGWMADHVRTEGLESLTGRYYGLAAGIVADNADPENRGRCRIQIPSLGMLIPADVPIGYWALPCMPGLARGPEGGQMHGAFVPPEVGDQVWVAFEHGDTASPVYLGGWLPQAAAGPELTSAGAGKVRGIRTPAGHVLRFSDDGDDLHIILAKGDGAGALGGAFLTIDKEGSVQVMSESGSHLWLDAVGGAASLFNVDPATGASTSWVQLRVDEVQVGTASGALLSMQGGDVSLDAPGNITLSAGGKVWLNAATVCLGQGPVYEPAVRGMKFMQWALIHQHTSAAPGAPTAPGATPPPAPFKELSEVVSIG